MSTKPRSDAVLLNLSEENKEQLRVALLGGMGYADACALAQKEFGARAAISAMCHFWKQECWPEIILRRMGDLKAADDIALSVETSPGQFAETARRAIYQRIFQLSTIPDQSAANIKALSEILRKDRAVAVQEGALAIKRRSAELEEEDSARTRWVNKTKFEEELSHEAGHQRFRDHGERVAAWEATQKNGKNPGPKPVWVRSWPMESTPAPQE